MNVWKWVMGMLCTGGLVGVSGWVGAWVETRECDAEHWLVGWLAVADGLAGWLVGWLAS